jgi:hypothetical protein
MSFHQRQLRSLRRERYCSRLAWSKRVDFSFACLAAWGSQTLGSKSPAICLAQPTAWSGELTFLKRPPPWASNFLLLRTAMSTDSYKPPTHLALLFPNNAILYVGIVGSVRRATGLVGSAPLKDRQYLGHHCRETRKQSFAGSTTSTSYSEAIGNLARPRTASGDDADVPIRNSQSV